MAKSSKWVMDAQSGGDITATGVEAGAGCITAVVAVAAAVVAAAAVITDAACGMDVALSQGLDGDSSARERSLPGWRNT